MLVLTSQGLGVGLAPALCVKKALDSALVFRALVTTSVLRQSPVRAIYTPRRMLVPKVRAFVEFAAAVRLYRLLAKRAGNRPDLVVECGDLSEPGTDLPGFSRAEFAVAGFWFGMPSRMLPD